MEPAPNLAIPLSAETLEALVENLYPEPSVVDVLTLTQFIFRYKFSGLGATAVADMERAQRITRTVGDHEQIGLAEFHIGLIYLHWGQYLGAVQYFDDAQRHWKFAKKDLAISLAQFAQGIAQQHAYHYEPALASYGKVQRTLKRVKGNGYEEQAEFLEEFESILDTSRADIVYKIRNLGEGEPAAFRVPIPDIAPPTLADEQETRETPSMDSAEPAPAAEGESARTQAAPQPINNMQRAEGSTPQPEVMTPELPPEPATTEESGIPVETPELLTEKQEDEQPSPNINDSVIWYDITNREDLEEFLPDIRSDTMLLVDTRTDIYACEEGDLVLVDQVGIKGSIQLKPQALTELKPFHRIFLAEVDEFAFKRDPTTGEIKFFTETAEEVGKVKLTAEHSDFPVFAEDIIGIVVGILHKLSPAHKEPI